MLELAPVIVGEPDALLIRDAIQPYCPIHEATRDILAVMRGGGPGQLGKVPIARNAGCRLFVVVPSLVRAGDVALRLSRDGR